jgi:hypothetical protein
LCAASDK